MVGSLANQQEVRRPRVRRVHRPRACRARRPRARRVHRVVVYYWLPLATIF